MDPSIPSSLNYIPRARNNYVRVMRPLPECIRQAIIDLHHKKCNSEFGNFGVILCERIAELLVLKKSIEITILHTAICEVLGNPPETFDARHYFRSVFSKQLDTVLERMRKQAILKHAKHSGRRNFKGNIDGLPSVPGVRIHRRNMRSTR